MINLAENTPAPLTMSAALLWTQPWTGTAVTWRQTRLRIISTFRGAAVGGVWGWPAVADEGIPLLTPPPVTGSFLAAGLQPHSR